MCEPLLLEILGLRSLYNITTCESVSNTKIFFVVDEVVIKTLYFNFFVLIKFNFLIKFYIKSGKK